MAYRIVLSPAALADLDEAYGFIHLHSAEGAAKWLSGIWKEIFSLADHPSGYPRIPESDAFDYVVRQTIYHSHRIVFRIDERSATVEVARVYHGARKPLQDEDLP